MESTSWINTVASTHMREMRSIAREPPGRQLAQVRWRAKPLVTTRAEPIVEMAPIGCEVIAPERAIEPKAMSQQQVVDTRTIVPGLRAIPTGRTPVTIIHARESPPLAHFTQTRSGSYACASRCSAPAVARTLAGCVSAECRKPVKAARIPVRASSRRMRSTPIRPDTTHQIALEEVAANAERTNPEGEPIEING